MAELPTVDEAKDWLLDLWLRPGHHRDLPYVVVLLKELGVALDGSDTAPT